MDRRTFFAGLGVLGIGSVGLGAAVRGRMTDVDERRDPRQHAGPRVGSAVDAWGVQLYTLREALAVDFDATVEAVAAVGYREVELFQLHGLTPRELRARLDAVGLRATSSHYGLDAIRGDLERTIEGALTLGQSLMVVPSIPGSERTPAGLARVADDLNRAGEAVRAAGLRFGYHNHDWELRALEDGTVPMDLLLDRTDGALVDWQMDIYWTVHGGADPLEQLERRSGRVTSVHVKDRTADGRMVDVGDGVIDFAGVLGEALGRGLRHAYVEHDRPGDPVESVRRSYAYLVGLAVGA